MGGEVVRGVIGDEKETAPTGLLLTRHKNVYSKNCCDIDGYFWGRGRSGGVFRGSFHLSLVPLATPKTGVLWGCEVKKPHFPLTANF